MGCFKQCNFTMKYYVFLVLAIVAELFATASLKKANGFTVLLPSLTSVAGYTLSAFFLSWALKQIPIGVAYSVWASLGIVCTTLIGYYMYSQKLDLAGFIGIFLILVGVMIVTGFSKTIA
jgi:small multidrug resistance pump